jgi:hypothetical protein
MQVALFLNGRKVVNTGDTNMVTSRGTGDNPGLSPAPGFFGRHKNLKNKLLY